MKNEFLHLKNINKSKDLKKIEAGIEKAIGRQKKILQYIEKDQYIAFANYGEDILSQKCAHTFIYLLLRRDCVNIKDISSLIGLVYSCLNIKWLIRKNILDVGIGVSYLNDKDDYAQLFKFVCGTKCISNTRDFSPELLRATGPKRDSGGDIEHPYCSWHYIERFPDESDKIWKIFKENPDYIMKACRSPESSM